MVEGKIIKVSGPLVIAEGMRNANMFDVVRVGEKNLIGEIIEMHGDRASIHRGTAGLGARQGGVHRAASVELGRDWLSIYDGIQRPLEVMRDKIGPNIARGVDEPALSREKKWHFEAAKKPGDRVSGGDVYGYVQETEVMLHLIMVPPKKSGTIVELDSGDFTVTEPAGRLRLDNGSEEDIKLMQRWPVRWRAPTKLRWQAYDNRPEI